MKRFYTWLIIAALVISSAVTVYAFDPLLTREGTSKKPSNESESNLPAFTITPTNNVDSLINALVVPGSGITIKSVTFSGAPTAAGLYYEGPFNMEDGIILASGDVTNALPPNTAGDISTNFNLPGCEECDSIIPGYVSYDAAILEIIFDVNDSCHSISFEFIFGSEEYPEWVGSPYNDVFGAYLNGTQVAFDSDGNPITINGPFFSSGAVQIPPDNGMEYDGSTAKLKTIATVVPGSTDNTLVFVVCDAGDHILDSGVLLKSLKGDVVDTVVTGFPPEFVLPPDLACGDTLYAYVNETITFTIEAVDNGPNNDVVTLDVGPLPDGASIDPSLPQTGNPVTCTFNWVPTSEQSGTYFVDFVVNDSIDGLSDYCTFAIVVEDTSTIEDTLIIPTNEWIDVYCAGPELNGVPLAPGDEIAAYDPDGVLCGIDTVRPDGNFGFMPIYRDDIYSPIDEGAEPGDTIRFKINGEEVFTDPPVIWTASGDQIEVCFFTTERCLQIDLTAGWNLISWNVAYSAAIDEIMAQLGKCSCVEVILGFDQGGLTYDPDLAEYSTLLDVDYYHGYWFKMSCDASFEVCGLPIGSDENITVYNGWNLVSYWPNDTLTVEDGFASILSNVMVALGFDGGGQIWLPGDPAYNTLTELKPLFGYWTKMSSDDILVYPGFLPGGTPKVESGSQMAASDLVPSRRWISLYGSDITLDGVELAPGASIEAYTSDGVLCGRSRYVDGVLKFTPVYGYDNMDELTQSYPKAGESVTLYVNGQRVYPEVEWSGHGSRVRIEALYSSRVTSGLPDRFELYQNYPNPFNPSTEIRFSLPSAGEVRLEVYNMLGQKVATLVDGYLEAGEHIAIWEGTDLAGRPVSTGVYLYRLQSGDLTASKKMLLLK
jgi:hypothetical protein